MLKASSTAKRPYMIFGVRHFRGMAEKHDENPMAAASSSQCLVSSDVEVDEHQAIDTFPP